MRASRCCIAAIMLASVGLVASSISGQPRRSATVTLSLFSSFGEPIAACHVEGFLSFNEGDKTEYRSRFHGLTGTGIPFGKTYRAILRCEQGGILGPFWISVQRTHAFVVLGVWSHPGHGDYYTGAEPRLTVYVAGSPVPKTEQQWIKIVGEYSDEHEVDDVSVDSHSARFYNFFPGRFLLLLVAADKLLCDKQVDLLGPGARLQLSVSPSGCTVKALAAVKAVE